MAHFKPFTRAQSGAPSHRCSSHRDDSYGNSRGDDRRRNRRRRDRGLLGDLLGL